jgi:cell wall-associated NlpC family hydrolase
MRQVTLALSTVFMTATLALFVLLLADPEARSQARAAELQDATGDASVPSTTSQEPPEETSFGETSVSQGSLPGADAPPEVIAAMDSPTDYSQVVDNDSSGRFKAPGWGTESSAQYYYGENYGVEKPAGSTRPAQFKVEIPAEDYYSVYAWWPAGTGNSTAARFGISTISGIKWTEVNQRRDGGDWVKIGDYQMEAGDSYAIQVSPDGGSGAVIADAVAVVRGAFASPPYGEQASGGGEQLYSASSVGSTGHGVVRVARNHKGTPYRASPPNPCRAFRSEDCSCHTKVVFRRFDVGLFDSPVRQFNRGQWIARSNLRRGDIVFFKEAGPSNPITHVGIYSGNGNLIHASNYFNKVVESKMRYIEGYHGAKRLRLN